MRGTRVDVPVLDDWRIGIVEEVRMAMVWSDGGGDGSQAGYFGCCPGRPPPATVFASSAPANEDCAGA